MIIDFYVGPTWEELRPAMLTEGGCGGSEVALIRMAEELAKRGHRVSVFGPHVGQYNVGGERTVDYYHYDDFGKNDVHADVTVMWRNVAPVAHTDIPGRVVLWLHDLGLPSVPSPIAERIDDIFVLSDFHGRSILRDNAHMAAKVKKTFNGVNVEYYPNDNPTKLPFNYFYSSSPRRGLGKLLREWPEVVKSIPDAVLHVAYGFDLSILMCEKIGNFREADIYRSMLKSIQKGIPGVKYHGRLSQPDLAALQRSCVGWLYPPNDFEETFCITALEAQMAKCVPITRRNGALPEVLGEYAEWTQGSTLNAIRTHESVNLNFNYQHAARYTWANAAEQWENWFK